MTASERILLYFCRQPDDPEYEAGTTRANLENALGFLIKTVPNFLSMAEGKHILDFGCGHGLQAAALARSFPSSKVVGLDLPRPTLLQKWRLYTDLPNLTLTTELPQQLFDIVISCSSFEHFSDPAGMVDRMREHTKPGGRVIISFAEPWLSPRGSHMDGFTRLPWVNVFFSEKTVLRVRSRFRNDGARRYEEVEGGLNRMTIRKFLAIIRNSGMHIESLNFFPVKGIPVVHRIPGIREFFIAAASTVLIRPV